MPDSVLLQKNISLSSFLSSNILLQLDQWKQFLLIYEFVNSAFSALKGILVNKLFTILSYYNISCEYMY